MEVITIVAGVGVCLNPRHSQKREEALMIEGSKKMSSAADCELMITSCGGGPI